MRVADPVGVPLERRSVPVRALVISLAALLIPVVDQVLFGAADQSEPMLWLLTLIPAFLLSYYRGWTGSLHAVTGGMLLLVGFQIAHGLTGTEQDYRLLLGLVVAILILGFGIGLVTELLHRAREDAVAMAFSDGLTGLANRRQAERILYREFSAARRGRPIVVTLFDIDDFKMVNDRFGHARGDEVLVRVARVLARHTREMNLTARYGGEEFLSILSASELEGAQVFVQRVLDAIGEIEIEGMRITASAGLAAYSPELESYQQLVSRADGALYAAKRAGKGVYRIADTGPDGEIPDSEPLRLAT